LWLHDSDTFEIKITALTLEKKTTLKSFDSEILEVEQKIAVESQTIKSMIEDNCADVTEISVSPTQLSSIMGLIVCDSNATSCSTLKISLS
jgi:formylmethanofuran dehydrogenase subunit E